tara:strand:+ start:527 stop:802 length:276 start_codon:yes stop_codon:yes gene_type:complete
MSAKIAHGPVNTGSLTTSGPSQSALSVNKRAAVNTNPFAEDVFETTSGLPKREVPPKPSFFQWLGSELKQFLAFHALWVTAIIGFLLPIKK